MGSLAISSKTWPGSRHGRAISSFPGKLAKKHKMIWGGDWGKPDVKHRFVDSVHVQRCTVARQRTLFAGTWYPTTATIHTRE
jgi:hypothetical protein